MTDWKRVPLEPDENMVMAAFDRLMTATEINAGSIQVAVREAIAAAPELPDDELWQPIETMPKDGTFFLACNKDDYSCIELLMYKDEILFNLNSLNETDLRHWTHWMPQPEPPK